MKSTLLVQSGGGVGLYECGGGGDDRDDAGGGGSAARSDRGDG